VYTFVICVGLAKSRRLRTESGSGMAHGDARSVTNGGRQLACVVRDKPTYESVHPFASHSHEALAGERLLLRRKPRLVQCVLAGNYRSQVLAHDGPPGPGVVQPENADELLEMVVHYRVVHPRVHVICILGYDLSAVQLLDM
jgi:hypothetical protein